MPAIKIQKFTVRGNYPSYHVIRNLINQEDNPSLKGYIKPVIEYELENHSELYSLELHFSDLHFLSSKNKDSVSEYIALLHNSLSCFDQDAIVNLEKKRNRHIKDISSYYNDIEFVENDYVVPSSTYGKYGIREISHKGESLLELSQKGYPVPDFSVLTSNVFPLSSEERKKHVQDCIRNLEFMTGNTLGSDKKPLVFAMRCAMSKYIPGLMPTYLNVGVTQDTFVALKDQYGFHVASKIYLNNLLNIYELLFPDVDPPEFDSDMSRHSFKDIYRYIQFFYDEIAKVDRKLLVDPEYQILFFIDEVYKFYRNNKELLLSLYIKDKSYPSLILQKMVWTVRDKESYPGVFYSRHSRTGLGSQIESYPEIFGEDIMTGAIKAIDTEFFDVEEIKNEFPAIYHFYDEVNELEKDLRSPVTIEFAAESFMGIHFFALLQLNNSEMTGRATLLSAIDLYQNGIINKERVINLVHPYHLRQIFSDSINDSSVSKLQYFSSGVSVLPRLATSCKVYFTADKALEAKKLGEKVCLCKDQFIPSDTIVMGEVDAIISLNPAAIHVVTACLSYGVPAFLNLEKYHVRIDGETLVNSKGLVIKEGDWVTISSKNKKIFLGEAKYVSARLQRYLDGENLDLESKEEVVFRNLAKGYSLYRDIVAGLDHSGFEDLSDLSKYIRTDLKSEPVKAGKIMNSWFDSNVTTFVNGVLSSKLGMHKEMHDLYSLLVVDRQIIFYKHALLICKENSLSAYTAGAFMLGRFLNTPHTITFWKSFNSSEICFIINEFLSYEKYLIILNEVGERKISKARDFILNKGIKDIRLETIMVNNFISLKLSKPNWNEISGCNKDENSQDYNEFIQRISLPFGELFDYKTTWSINKLMKVCERENVVVPLETDE